MYRLFVALPALWCYEYFSSKIKSFGIEIECSSLELMPKRWPSVVRHQTTGKSSSEIVEREVIDLGLLRCYIQLRRILFKFQMSRRIGFICKHES